MSEVIQRRAFLRGAVSVAGLATGGAVLASCGGDSDAPTDGGTTTASTSGSPAVGSTASSSGGSSGATGGVPLPDYVEYTGAGQPDLPGSTAGVLPAYYKYPASPVPSVTTKPASGGTVSALVLSGGAATPMNQNHLWQELNRQLGATLKIDAVPSADLASKIATTIASGDLPDFMMLSPLPPHTPEVLASKFADLTEFLAGDGIKKYPNLANIPTTSWRNCVFNGSIHAIPVPRGIAGNVLNSRVDLLKAAGLPQSIDSGQALMDVGNQFVAKNKTKWAFYQSPTTILTAVMQMTGAPNVWRVEGGKFTSQWETEEVKQAIDIVTQMWGAGHFNPDAFTGLPSSSFAGGNYLFSFGNYLTWQSQLNQLVNDPSAEVGAFTLPQWAGGGISRQFLGTGVSSITGIKKSDKARIEELLRVADYIAAPFGTTEYLLMEFGVKDIGYTLIGTDPKLTTVGNSELRIADYYITRAMLPLYSAGNPDATKAQHDYQVKVVPDGLPAPTVGLYSDTDLQQGGNIGKTIVGVVADIIQGRKKLNQWDGAVSDWKKAGGDAIRKEYEASYAATH